ncbi:MAG: hypothetical protein M3Q24_01360 [bacterium]|nr:hypothetical protein [bacterium]
MQLSEKQLDKFISLYQKNFGVALDRETATEKGVRLINLVSLVYKPINENKYEKHCKKI